MMNKKIIILAVLITLSSLTACSDGGDKAADTTQSVTANTTTQSAETTTAQNSNNNDASAEELQLTSMFPMTKVYIDGPSYQIVENGSTLLYNVNGNRFIALTSSKMVKVSKSSEVLDAYLELFKSGVKTNCNGSRPVKFDISESNEVNINGIDFYRFKGNLICNNTSEDKKCFAVGYTFIKDKKPCQIVGAVVSDEQDQKDIDEITKYVDAMVKTIRDKRNPNK